MLDTLEMAALRRAATALKHWAEGLRIHSDIVRENSSGSIQTYDKPNMLTKNW